MSALLVLDLLPARMDVNGDRGNVLAVVRRLEWAGLSAVVVTGDDPRWWAAEPDLVHVSGPTVAGQRAALAHVGGRREALDDWAAAGVPVLGVAGGYHLLLDRLRLPGAEEEVPGLGLLPGTSRPAARTSGFTVLDTADGRVHGYHNLGQEAVPEGAAWGAVVAGGAGVGRPEGASRGTVLGTNLNGPLLPRNPVLADRLLRLAAGRRGLEYAPGGPHRAADLLAARANAVLHARATARRTASYTPAGRARGLQRPG